MRPGENRVEEGINKTAQQDGISKRAATEQPEAGAFPRRGQWGCLKKARLDGARIYFLWGAYWCEYGGTNMPLTGPVPEGGTFFCPHCGAMYSVTHSRLPKRDSNIAKCVVCKQTMDERDSSKVPVYKLIHRPEDA